MAKKKKNIINLISYIYIYIYLLKRYTGPILKYIVLLTKTETSLDMKFFFSKTKNHTKRCFGSFGMILIQLVVKNYYYTFLL